jgi:hypothetical protein
VGLLGWCYQYCQRGVESRGGETGESKRRRKPAEVYTTYKKLTKNNIEEKNLVLRAQVGLRVEALKLLKA